MNDAGPIADELAGRIDSLARDLLPKGDRRGHLWVEAQRSAGGLGDSLIVNLRKGRWDHYAAGTHGDALDLVAYLLFQGDIGEALQWARAWLGHATLDPGQLRARRLQAEQLQAQRREDVAKHAEEMHGAAMRIFLAAQPVTPASPVDLYLQGRGLRLAELGRQPRALRHHPRLWNTESKRHWHAMVAAIADASGTMVAVHRTWLEQGADGRWRKAPLQDAKLTLGRYSGGSIRLWRGASKKSLRDAPAGEEVTIGEGIEDSLTAAIDDPARRVLAAVSGGNMTTLILPPQIAGVLLLGQNEDNPTAWKHWGRVVAHFQGQGKRVRWAAPPVAWKDLAELQQWETAPARAASVEGSV